MPYDPKTKPDPNLCPREFCFHWEEKGWLTTRGSYSSRAEALRALQPVQESGCGWEFGRCRRWLPEGTKDFYEPCEPKLIQAGLPWFYFMTAPSKLVEERLAEYIRESEALWGKRHWEN